MGWTLQGSKVVGSGPQVRAEIDASRQIIYLRLGYTSIEHS